MLVVVVVVVVCIRAARGAVECGCGLEAKHASWRGGLQALLVLSGGGVEGGRATTSIFTLYR